MDIAPVYANWVGELVDERFPLLEPLGESEQSAVFLTELPGTESRKAAIKLIPAQGADAEMRLAHWERVRRLSHPHLIQLFQSGRCEINGTPLVYIVMTYAEENLSQVLPLRPLAAGEIREMLSALIDVVSYIHEEELVHGHIKPSNIMAVDDQLKLSSDDIERPGEIDTSALKLNAYDAPEIATGMVGPAADVWSLGVALVIALTQHAPVWDKNDSGDLLLPGSVAEPFRSIVRECLRRDSRERCTLAQITQRLEQPAAPLKVADRSAAMRHRRRVVPAILIGLVVLTIGVATIVRHSMHTRPTSTSDARQLVAAHIPPGASQNRSSQGANTPANVLVRGAVAKRALPDVPEKARNTIRGSVKVDVRISVDPSGQVASVALDSPGPSRYFAKLALQAARSWRFQPPQVDARNVASRWILRFRFGRAGTEVEPLEIAP